MPQSRLEAALSSIPLIDKHLQHLEHAGRHNSPEAIEFRAFHTALAWVTASGQDPERFERILLNATGHPNFAKSAPKSA